MWLNRVGLWVAWAKWVNCEFNCAFVGFSEGFKLKTFIVGWKNIHANTEENYGLNKIWLEDVNVHHAYRKWENRLLHKCFKKKRMDTVLRNRYNKKIGHY